MQQKEVDYKGRKLSYRTKGEGNVILLLHGFGEDGSIWKEQYDLFPGHQLIIPDLPGSGASEMIEDMSMEGMADAVKFIITQVRPPRTPPKEGLSTAQPLLKPGTNNISVTPQSEVSAAAIPLLGRWGATLIGHSMGGYITLAYAEKYPDDLNAFGLFHSTAFADNEEKKEVRKKGISFTRQHGAYEFLKTSVPNLYAPGTKETKAGLIEDHLASVRNFSAEALVNYYEAMMQRPDRTEVLRKAAVPVLFVFGKYDTAVPLADGLKQSHLPQLSYIHILENAGHMGMKEEVTATNKILSDFVTANH